MSPQLWVMLAGISATVLSGVIGATWFLAWRISSIDAKVELILTNHLPHIYEELKKG